ncbi:hypothetical protein Poly59_12990 [Rubripirellula reticaptiva]|uniref:Uncharacterized protein n=1 Tax=Rubripirellula reticaptiva TaxID=2528013 RepID=A0A5C6FAI4_9BACT|nr:hypothetical protein Poly59_12990 [Rubripirellula reticaptiva]
MRWFPMSTSTQRAATPALSNVPHLTSIEVSSLSDLRVAVKGNVQRIAMKTGHDSLTTNTNLHQIIVTGDGLTIQGRRAIQVA